MQRSLLTGLMFDAELSRVAAEPDVHQFAGIANAASSFDVAEWAKFFAAKCVVCHQPSGRAFPESFSRSRATA